MIYSITDKLQFAEKPILEIKGKKLTINNEASVILQIMALFKGEVTDIAPAVELLFSEKDRKALESLHLNVADYTKVIRVALALATGEDPDKALEEEEQE